MKITRILGVFAALHTVGCEHYVPAEFADRPVVAVVKDEQPSPVPDKTSFDERVQISDIYVRRPLFDLVHPLDFATGGDVNAADEVPASSWYDPDGHDRPEAGATPPVLPVTVLDEDPVTSDDALVVRDSRGARYELVTDPAQHAGLATGADILGGELVRAIGLHAPPAFLVSVPETEFSAGGEAGAGRLLTWEHGKEPAGPEGRRVSATLWPGGIDVGFTGDFSIRRDDPNDTVDHNDRRTLRAMKVFGHWLGWNTFDVRHTRDAYIGRPGEGHVMHFIVGLSQAFGTRALHDEPTVDEQSGSALHHLVTFGLSPVTRNPRQRSAFSSLGLLPPTVGSEDYGTSPPYSPFARFTPADQYWAAKRLLDPAVNEALTTGLAAAQYPDAAARALRHALENRRAELVTRVLRAVTPLEVLEPTLHAVKVEDVAIAIGLESSAGTRYQITYLGTEGGKLAPSVTVRAAGANTSLPLPREVLGVVVLHVRARRGDRTAPRACDVHVVVTKDAARVIGVRH